MQLNKLFLAFLKGTHEAVQYGIVPLLNGSHEFFPFHLDLLIQYSALFLVVLDVLCLHVASSYHEGILLSELLSLLMDFSSDFVHEQEDISNIGWLRDVRMLSLMDAYTGSAEGQLALL